MITKQIAMGLRYRQELQHNTLKNHDGTPMRCRVNGKCKTWKSKAFETEFELPVKHGLRNCFYITLRNAGEWNTTQS